MEHHPVIKKKNKIMIHLAIWMNLKNVMLGLSW